MNSPMKFSLEKNVRFLRKTSERVKSYKQHCMAFSVVAQSKMRTKVQKNKPAK